MAIPAAGIGQNKLDVLMARDPRLGAELATLNRRVLAGSRMLEAEYLRYVTILFDFGENTACQQQLRAMIEHEGDAFHALYVKLFREKPDAMLLAAIKDFQTRGKMVLREPKRLQFLSIEYFARVPAQSPLRLLPPIAPGVEYHVTFSGYGELGEIEVDLQAEGALDALPLTWNGSRWKRCIFGQCAPVDDGAIFRSQPKEK